MPSWPPARNRDRWESDPVGPEAERRCSPRSSDETVECQRCGEKNFQSDSRQPLICAEVDRAVSLFAGIRRRGMDGSPAISSWTLTALTRSGLFARRFAQRPVRTAIECSQPRPRPSSQRKVRELSARSSPNPDTTIRRTPHAATVNRRAASPDADCPSHALRPAEEEASGS